MKPKEYRRKYPSIESEGKLRSSEQNEFLQDFEADFIKALNVCINNLNLTRFKSLVAEIRNKWDNVFNETLTQHEPLWKYFYASVIIPNKETFCGDELRAQKAAYEKRKREQEEWRRWNDPFTLWDEMYRERMNQYQEVLKSILINPCPVQSFKYFGYEPNEVPIVSKEMILKQYKESALLNHPDKGGNTTNFQELVMHKERCVSFLEKRQKQNA